MSGYLEVKLCCKGNRGLTPWKTWRKQWCILRPSPLKEGGVFIIFHTSAGLASNSQVEIPRHSLVYRTDSKTKNYAFGVFPSADSRKPIVLLAGQSESDSQLWLGRIRALLHGNHKSEKTTVQRNTFSVSLIDNTFAHSCGFKGLYGNLSVARDGFQICDSSTSVCKMYVKWDHISEMALCPTEKQIDKNKICSIITNRDFEYGHGQFLIFCQSGTALLKLLRNKTPCDSPEVTLRKLNRRISRSEGTLFRMPDSFQDVIDSQRDSGLSSCGPASSESYIKADGDSSLRISVNDTGLVLKGKMASTIISTGMMLSNHRFNKNCSSPSLERIDDFLSPLQSFPKKLTGMNRRCSNVSIASGIYEEISEHPPDKQQRTGSCYTDNTYEVLGNDWASHSLERLNERIPPPPLPPRTRTHTGSASDSGVDEESLCSTPQNEKDDGKWCTIHGSLPRLTPSRQRDDSISSKFSSETVNIKPAKFQSAFDVFRRRIKSDSQVGKSQESKTPKSCNNDCGQGNSSRKRLFEFNVTPSKSIHKVKNSKMGKALRKLGMGNANSLKNNAKSCETLECKDVPCEQTLTKDRCSKSEENLEYRVNAMNGVRDESYETKKSNLNLSAEWCSEGSDENAKDLSVICTENSIKHCYPQDLVDLLLKGKVALFEMKLKQRAAEEEYVLMSPFSKFPRTDPTSDNTSNPTSDNVEPPSNPVHCPKSNIEENYVVMKSA